MNKITEILFVLYYNSSQQMAIACYHFMFKGL